MSYILWNGVRYYGYWYTARFKTEFLKTNYYAYLSFDGTGGVTTMNKLNSTVINGTRNYWVFVLAAEEEYKLTQVKAEVLVTAMDGSSNPNITDSNLALVYVPKNYMKFKADEEVPDPGWDGTPNFYNINYNLQGGYFPNPINSWRIHDTSGGVTHYQDLNPSQTCYGTYGSNNTARQWYYTQGENKIFINYRYLMVENPRRSGYTFTGWTITNLQSGFHWWKVGVGDNTGSGTSFSTGANGVPSTVTEFYNLRQSSGTVTFTARWESNTQEVYNIQYNLGDGGYFPSGTSQITTHSSGHKEDLNPTVTCYGPNGSVDTHHYFPLDDGTYVNHTYFSVETPLRSGYTFNGWTITNLQSGFHWWKVGGGDNTGSGTSFETNTASVPLSTHEFYNLRQSNGIVLFTAKWVKNPDPYTIYYYFFDDETTWAYYTTEEISSNATSHTLLTVPTFDDYSCSESGTKKWYFYDWDDGPTNTAYTSLPAGTTGQIALYQKRTSNGFVRIYDNGTWKKARPYIYNGTTWIQAKPYIYQESTGWIKYGG